MLKRLNEVDEKIDDLVASTDETTGEVDMAEGLKIDVEANIEITNQAIRDLSAQESDAEPESVSESGPEPVSEAAQDEEPGDAYPPLASAPERPSRRPAARY